MPFDFEDGTQGYGRGFHPTSAGTDTGEEYGTGSDLNAVAGPVYNSLDAWGSGAAVGSGYLGGFGDGRHTTRSDEAIFDS